MGGPKSIAIVVSLAALMAPAGAAATTTGGTAPPAGRTTPTSTGGAQFTPPPPVVVPGVATIENGKAYAPPGAPLAVVRAIRAGNKLQNKPYRYGGGHRAFKDTAYDCSGTVSYMLHGAGVLASPLDSTELMTWGLPGPGRWISIYSTPGHAYAVVAGLRLDTSGSPSGPRWRSSARSGAGFTVRHPAGL